MEISDIKPRGLFSREVLVVTEHTDQCLTAKTLRGTGVLTFSFLVMVLTSVVFLYAGAMFLVSAVVQSHTFWKMLLFGSFGLMAVGLSLPSLIAIYHVIRSYFSRVDLVINGSGCHLTWFYSKKSRYAIKTDDIVFRVRVWRISVNSTMYQYFVILEPTDLIYPDIVLGWSFDSEEMVIKAKRIEWTLKQLGMA